MDGNAYWYLGLGLFSVILLVYVCFKREPFPVLMLTLVMVQAAYLIETVIYIFLDSYRYLPKLIPDDAYYDSNMGALTSNLLFIPAVSVLIAAFRLPWSRILLIIAAIHMVEWGFVRLGIYTLHWWRVEYTSAGLLFYFPLGKAVYLQLLTPVRGWMRRLILFLCTAPLLGTLHILPIMLLRNRDYQPGWFDNPSHDTTAFSSLYYLASALVLVAVESLPRLSVWRACLLLAAFYGIVTAALRVLDVLVVHTRWDPWYYSLFPSALYLLVHHLGRRLSEGPSGERSA